jgi:hypothetical protein
MLRERRLAISNLLLITFCFSPLIPAFTDQSSHPSPSKLTLLEIVSRFGLVTDASEGIADTFGRYKVNNTWCKATSEIVFTLVRAADKYTLSLLSSVIAFQVQNNCDSANGRPNSFLADYDLKIDPSTDPAKLSFQGTLKKVEACEGCPPFTMKTITGIVTQVGRNKFTLTFDGSSLTYTGPVRKRNWCDMHPNEVCQQ